MHSEISINYQPCPLPIGEIEIPQELTALVETLAKHVHDVWAFQRMSDGWTFGERRDDAAKKHPCLVSYEELPESEKKYDRSVAVDTVRAIIVLGFTVTKGT